MQSFDPASSVSEQLDNLPQFLNTQTAQRGGATLFGDAYPCIVRRITGGSS
jgi:hypothetical protein